MAVSKELILELQTIIREDYEKELDFQQASLIANDLVGHFDLLAKMHHRDNGYENDIADRERN
jgi:hypothetical protein